MNAAFEDIKQNTDKYKKSWGLRFYKLMNKLRNFDPDMWKLIYRLIYETLNELPIKDFIYFWEKYHKDHVNVDENFREDLFKMMELRLRSFPPSSILKVYHILQEFGRINHYWIENVFVNLFKSPGYIYKPEEVAEIIKIMIFVGHEVRSR
ncbi:MAG: hypothetical protein JST59_02700 [Actinobacteria bacterium]|nr:hypothetical protein [Actinomycetota bacterium]